MYILARQVMQNVCNQPGRKKARDGWPQEVGEGEFYRTRGKGQKEGREREGHSRGGNVTAGGYSEKYDGSHRKGREESMNEKRRRKKI